jgi:hypothetical protein
MKFHNANFTKLCQSTPVGSFNTLTYATIVVQSFCIRGIQSRRFGRDSVGVSQPFLV